MKNLHPLALIGGAINIIAGLVMLSQIGGGSYWDTVDTVFALVAVGGVALTIIGVILLAVGNRAGGIVGAIGGAFFVPIGLIGMIGFMMSRTRMQTAGFEKSDLERAAEIVAERQRLKVAQEAAQGSVQEAVGGRRETSGSVGAGEPASVGDSGSFSAAKNMGDGAVRAVSVENTAGGQDASAKLAAPSYAEITAPSRAAASARASAYFPFADQRIIFVVLLVVCVIAFLALSSSYRSGTSMLFPIIVCVVFIVLQSRVSKWPVLALYEEHLEFVPNLYSSLLSIRYASILKATVSRGSAKLWVRRPDGVEDVVKVPFGFIRGAQRDQAREAMRTKMRALGVLIDE